VSSAHQKSPSFCQCSACSKGLHQAITTSIMTQNFDRWTPTMQESSLTGLPCPISPHHQVSSIA
jgi:hypothetical protein